MNYMDAVISYVNCLDENWRRNYKNFFNSDYSKNRFRDLGTIDVCIDSIRRFAPFIKNIFVTVQNLSEIEFISNKKEIIPILHTDFIPEEYLPCFNSCTIELFLHRIPGLDEKFVYFNDDIFLLEPCKEWDFFWKDSPIYNMKSRTTCNMIHHSICKNSFQIMCKHLGFKIDRNLFWVSGHVPQPFIKTYNESIYELCKDDITISNKRDASNSQQHIYMTAGIYQGVALNRNFPYLYLRNTASDIYEKIINSGCKFCCVNDVGECDTHKIREQIHTAYNKRTA